MLKYNSWRFLAPDQGGPAAGASGQQAAASSAPATPFDKINLDDLDPDTRSVVEASKTEFANLQKQLSEATAKNTQLDGLARKFQGQHDQLAAKLQQQQPAQLTAAEAKIAQVEKVLIDRGVPTDQAKAQAPIFADMFGVFAAEIKGEIGRDLAPLGQSVMQGEANRAWQQALSADKLGALQVPEIAAKTWAGVQELAAAGQPVTAQTVLNLRNIYFAEHQEAGGQSSQSPTMSQQQPQAPQYPNFGPPPFAGGGQSPMRPAMQDANAPRHQLDPSTAAAIAKTVAFWPKKKK